MGNKPQFTAQQFIDAIPGTGGIITAIARKAGCNWHTAKNYINDHPTVKLAYDAECEGILDLAESKLIQAISEGDMAAVKYILSTKGKARGYVERQEQTTYNIDLSQLSEDQLERIASGDDPLSIIGTTKSSSRT